MSTTNTTAPFNPDEHQHIRYNPLRNEWVLVSPHRMRRPWSGQMESPDTQTIPPFDPTNPLCPGVVRASGITTPQYKSTFVFPNDFPALLEEGPEPPDAQNELFQCKAAKGTCRVMCYHPESNVYLATMTTEAIQEVINEWIKQLQELGAKYDWVQIFENRGAMMGCSNPHPHCQIWASSFWPNEINIKDRNLRQYYLTHKQQPLLADYLSQELVKKDRIVIETNEWVVLVPFWAVWPFETMILPRKQVQRLSEISAEQNADLAKAMKLLVTKYDNLFKCAFPYSMGWHGAPTGASLRTDMSHWTVHGIYCPPLLRSATVRKFIVGYELLAQSQRDLTPEKAALMLRQQSDVHYTLK